MGLHGSAPLKLVAQSRLKLLCTVPAPPPTPQPALLPPQNAEFEQLLAPASPLHWVSQTCFRAHLRHSWASTSPHALYIKLFQKSEFLK